MAALASPGRGAKVLTPASAATGAGLPSFNWMQKGKPASRFAGMSGKEAFDVGADHAQFKSSGDKLASSNYRSSPASGDQRYKRDSRLRGNER